MIITSFIFEASKRFYFKPLMKKDMIGGGGGGEVRKYRPLDVISSRALIVTLP